MKKAGSARCRPSVNPILSIRRASDWLSAARSSSSPDLSRLSACAPPVLLFGRPFRLF
jgi:hypothetical protein